MKHNYLLLAVLFGVYSCTSNLTSEVLTSSEYTEGIEGPAVAQNGDLFLVNFQEQGTIGRVPFEDTKGELFLKLPGGSIGNGIRFLNDSVFFVADYVNHKVLKINTLNKEVMTHAHDSTMNQPNDLAITAQGLLYASDPDWDKGTGQLWKVGLDGQTTLLGDNMGTTNGIEVSPGDNYLYVNESVQKRIWRYELLDDGSLANKRLFHQFDDFGLDGMRCDSKGNLYVTRYGKGTVAVLSTEGKLINEVALHGKNPTNIAFGGKDGKLVHVTLQDQRWVEVFKVKYRGRSFRKMN